MSSRRQLVCAQYLKLTERCTVVSNGTNLTAEVLLAAGLGVQQCSEYKGAAHLFLGGFLPPATCAGTCRRRGE